MGKKQGNIACSEIDAPQHVAIIMDGNRRWAKARDLPSVEGHRKGVEALRKAVQGILELGIPYATVFAFSSENWNRPKFEVRALFGIIREFIHQGLDDLIENNVKVNVIGTRQGLPRTVLEAIKSLEARSEGITHPSLHLCVAFNYGGRAEIVHATKAIAKKVIDAQIDPSKISEETVAAHLQTADVPDPDIVIRTSGEMRFSNFLPWQTAYSEFVVLPEMWPDFDGDALRRAIAIYNERSRRFGGK